MAGRSLWSNVANCRASYLSNWCRIEGNSCHQGALWTGCQVLPSRAFSTSNGQVKRRRASPRMSVLTGNLQTARELLTEEPAAAAPRIERREPPDQLETDWRSAREPVPSQGIPNYDSPERSRPSRPVKAPPDRPMPHSDSTGRDEVQKQRISPTVIPRADALKAREAAGRYLELLNFEMDWKRVWFGYRVLKFSDVRLSPSVMMQCHDRLLARLEKLLLARRPSTPELVDVLSWEKGMLDRSNGMIMLALKVLERSLREGGLEDAIYILRKLGPVVPLSSPAIRSSVVHCLRLSLAIVNQARHEVSPNDMVPVCWGCYKAGIQFASVMSYTRMICIPKLSELSDHNLLRLVSMSMRGSRDSDGDESKEQDTGSTLHEKLAEEISQRISRVAAGDRVGYLLDALLHLSSLEIEIDKDVLRTLCNYLSVDFASIHPKMIFRLAAVCLLHDFKECDFDFARKLCSVYCHLSPADSHYYFLIIARLGQLTDAVLDQVVQYASQSLKQYSLSDLATLCSFLAVKGVQDQGGAQVLAARIASELETRTEISGAVCGRLLTILSPYGCLSPELQMKLVQESYLALEHFSFEEFSRLMYCSLQIHRETTASHQKTKEEDLSTAELSDPRRKIRSMLVHHLPKFDLSAMEADGVSSVAVRRAIHAAAMMGIHRHDLLQLAARHLELNWKSMLHHAPFRFVNFTYDLSSLSCKAPKVFRVICKELDLISKPTEVTKSSVTSDVIYERRHPWLLKVGPTSPDMIRTVWACAVQGCIPMQAVRRLYSITPAEVESLPSLLVTHLFHIHTLVADSSQYSDLGGATMNERTVDLLHRRHASRPLSDIETEFLDEVSELMPDVALGKVTTGDGCRVVAALLLDAERKLVPWNKTVKEGLRASAQNFRDSGLTPCALFPLIPGVTTLYRTDVMHGSTDMAIRSLCASGWAVIKIPMLKWWKLKGEDKLKLLDGLQLVTSWKGFDEGPQFELTGELKPHQETGELPEFEE